MGDQSGLLVAVSPSEPECPMRTEVILTSPHEPPDDLEKRSREEPVVGIGPLMTTDD